MSDLACSLRPWREYMRYNRVTTLTSCRPTLSSSTSLSGGNQVDGLPPARHTEAIGGPHGGYGSAPMWGRHPRKMKIERNYKITLHRSSRELLNSIITLIQQNKSGSKFFWWIQFLGLKFEKKWDLQQLFWNDSVKVQCIPGMILGGYTVVYEWF